MTSFARAIWLTTSLVFSLFTSQFGLADNIFSQPSNQHPLPPEQAFTFDSQQVQDKLALVWNITDEYYLYRDKLSLHINGNDVTSTVAMPEAILKQDPIFGSTNVYYGQLAIMVDLPTLAKNSDLTVSYQGCWEGGVCYPPQEQQIALQSVVATSSLANNSFLVDGTEAPSADSRVSKSSGGVTGTNASWFTQQLTNTGIGTLILTFFLAGLGLALTPCVLPMVPILSNLIVGMSPKPGPYKSFLLSLTYVFAMAITYSLAGIVAGLSGANLQAGLQHPVIIALMVLLFVVFAAAMFDWITVQMPKALQNQLNRVNQRQSSGHFLGVAVMGVVSALIVGPCVAAPLAGALLYISQTGDPYTGGLALLALGLGMGLPVLAVGTSAGKLIPHAGAWMNRVKYGFGFLMLYMAVWMLDRIMPAATVPLVLLITLIWTLLLWQAYRWQPPVQSVLGRSIAYLIALLMTGYSMALLTSILAGQPSLIRPLQMMVSSNTQIPSTQVMSATRIQAQQVPNLLSQAQQLNKPVVIDIYADWCVSCKELDSFVFPDAQVQSALQEYVFLKVDVTANDETDKNLLAQYNLVGPPALLFIDRAGTWLASRTIIGVPTPDSLAHDLGEIASN